MGVVLPVLSLIMTLAACSSDDDLGALPDTPVETLYNSGLDALIAGDGEADACESFGESQSTHGGLGQISGTNFLVTMLEAMGYTHTGHRG